MAVKTKAQLLNDVVSQIVTNTNGEVTAYRLRTVLSDMIDSLNINLTSAGFLVVNRGSLGVDPTQVNTIQFNSSGNVFYVDSTGNVFTQTPSTLQQVTDRGNTTTNSIGVRDIYVYNSNNKYSVIKSLASSGNYTVNLPTKSGTVAFLDDLNGVTSFSLSADGSISDTNTITFNQNGAYLQVGQGEVIRYKGTLVVTFDNFDNMYYTADVQATVSRSSNGTQLQFGPSVHLLTPDSTWTPNPYLQFYKPDETQFTFILATSDTTLTAVHARLDLTATVVKTFTVATPPNVSITMDSPLAEGTENPSTFTFTVTRSGTLDTAFTISWSVYPYGSNPASAADFVSGVFPTGTLSFAPNETTKQVTVSIAGDSLFEQDETFEFRLENASVPINYLQNSLVGMIVNDDVQSQVDITAVNNTKNEGNTGSTDYTFLVSRSLNTNVTSSVDWHVTGYGANPCNAADFVGNAFPAGTVTFAPGETSKTFIVSIAGDNIVEQDEMFQVTLTNPVNCMLNMDIGYGIVTNDDVAPVAALSIAPTDATKYETDSLQVPFVFTVSRSNVLNSGCSANWSLDFTGFANPADASDFVGGTLPSGTIAFAPNETSKTITVYVQGDTLYESNESFRVLLTSPTNCTLTTPSAQATIFNDDPTPVPNVDNVVFNINTTSTGSINFNAGFETSQQSSYGRYEYEVDSSGQLQPAIYYTNPYKYVAATVWVNAPGTHTLRFSLGNDHANVIGIQNITAEVESISGLNLLNNLQYLTLIGNNIISIPSGLSNTVVNIDLSSNKISGDQSGITLPTALAALRIGNNHISKLAALPATLTTFWANDNNFDQNQVDSMLTQLDQNGRTGGYVTLSGNAVPSATGQAAATNLRGKGWTVQVSTAAQFSALMGVSMTGASGGYYEYLPEGYAMSTQNYPLIIFNHGVGEIGNGSSDLPNILNCWTALPRIIANNAFPSSFTVDGQQYKFIILCPQYKWWPGANDVNDIINYACLNYRVDQTRIYVTGLSMGGGVTWDFAAAYPNRAAAIVPICGASSPDTTREQAIATAQLPVWATHNDGDPTVSVSNTIGWVNGINSFGGNAIMDIFSANQHDAWSQTYDINFRPRGVDIYEWMLQHHK